MRLKTLTIASLTAAVLTTPLAAGAAGDKARMDQTRMEKGGDITTRTVIGRVVDVRDFQVRGADAHRLVMIERGGKRLMVDLGARIGKDDMDLQKGDVLYARGKAGRLNGKPMVFARWAAEIYPAGHRKAG